MIERYPTIYRLAYIAALLAIVLAFVLPNLLTSIEIALTVTLILLLGIPHGATDHQIFVHLNRTLFGEKRLEHFYLRYLSLMAIYSLIWWLVPGLALVVFLLLSAYHFGQSNWNYARFGSGIAERAVYLAWGAFILLLPILWHYDAASDIIAQLIFQEAPALSVAVRQAICMTLFIVNGWLITYAWAKGWINRRHMQQELINLLILTLLFVFTPLLLGFVIYFVCWHSVGSIADQIAFFKKRIRHYTWKHYVREALPLTLVSVLGLGLLYLLQMYLGLQTNISMLFIFISVVTLPHMLLIELLYQEWAMPEPEAWHVTDKTMDHLAKD